jgi:16S rRNA processing protein RimM
VTAASGSPDDDLRVVGRVVKAHGLRGELVVVPSTDNAEATDAEIEDPDEFHDHQLEGLLAELADGTVVGTVTAVLHGAGGELLVLEAPDGGELLVPFVAAIVPTVDLAGGRVVLDPPEGLFDPA